MHLVAAAPLCFIAPAPCITGVHIASRTIAPTTMSMTPIDPVVVATPLVGSSAFALPMHLTVALAMGSFALIIVSCLFASRLLHTWGNFLLQAAARLSAWRAHLLKDVATFTEDAGLAEPRATRTPIPSMMLVPPPIVLSSRSSLETRFVYLDFLLKQFIHRLRLGQP